MANYASSTVFFEGERDTLEAIQKLLITEGQYSQYAIDFSFMNGKVPGIDNKFVYQLFGCDWNKYIMKEYSTEELQHYHQKVAQFVKSQNWIGLRDAYVNESSRDVSSKIENGVLSINAEFSWYCPTLFFAKVAEEYGVKVKVLEYIEGNETILSYVNENGECIDTVNSSEALLQNKEFRNLSIELNLHNPSNICALAVFVGSKDIVEELVSQYQLTQENLKQSFQLMKNYGEEPWDIYHSSPFVGLDFEKLKSIDIESQVQQFNKLLESLEEHKDRGSKLK